MMEIFRKKSDWERSLRPANRQGLRHHLARIKANYRLWKALRAFKKKYGGKRNKDLYVELARRAAEEQGATEGREGQGCL